MKNNKIFYNFLFVYQIIMTLCLLFFCIQILTRNLKSLFVLVPFIICNQTIEIIIYIFFFYRDCKKFNIISILMDLLINIQFFYCGIDFAGIILNKIHFHWWTEIVKIIFVIYLIFCRTIRINEKQVQNKIQV